MSRTCGMRSPHCCLESRPVHRSGGSTTWSPAEMTPNCNRIRLSLTKSVGCTRRGLERRSGPAGLELVDLPRVLDEDLVLVLLGYPFEAPGQMLVRAGPGRGGVWEVGTPQ